MNTEQLQDDIQHAVQSGQDIKETVRRLTIKALTEGNLDSKSVRQVVDAVVKGASLGAQHHDLAAKDALDKAISGLDGALSKAAEASKLALQEVLARTEDFSSHDLKRALNDIQGLEALFVDVLRDVATGSKNQLSGMLHDLAEHAQHSGTAVGEEIKNNLAELMGLIADSGKTQLESGVDSVKTTGSLFARLAAGTLEGIADSLHPVSKADDKSKELPQGKN
ncbi:MAG: hypothetical protein Q9N32_08980 [Gammaproteobacteria bacterium]|nr:hypothetical protein [Gammaproteobacteria bacterium]